MSDPPPPSLKVVARLLCPHCKGGVRITMDGRGPESRPVRCPYCKRMFTYTPPPPAVQPRMEGDPDA